MASVTLNPSAGNGYVSNYKFFAARNEAAWDEVISATGSTLGTAVNPSAAGYLALSDMGSGGDTHLYAYRSFFPFDCSSLSGATINSAVLRVYIVAKPDNDYSESLYVVGTTQASYSTLATSDWGTAGSTSFCDTQPSVASLTTSAYYEFTLNASGRAAIASGNGRLAIRLSGDFSSTLPATPGFSQLGNYITTYFLAHGSSMPELVVDYTLPGGGVASRRRPSGLYIR